MSDVTDWIDEASHELGCEFVRCPPEIARQVLREAKSAFVRGNPRVWWLSLSQPFQRFDSSACRISDVVPSAHAGWLIAEDDSDELLVYELTVEEAELIRQNCPFFEYYYVDKQFRWLVAESDHNEFFVAQRQS